VRLCDARRSALPHLSSLADCATGDARLPDADAVRHAYAPVSAGKEPDHSGGSRCDGRLVASLWIGGEGTPSASRLGPQQSATSIGPILAPIAVAAISTDGQFVVAWGLAAASLMLTLSLSRLWPQRGAGSPDCPRP